MPIPYGIYLSTPPPYISPAFYAIFCIVVSFYINSLSSAQFPTPICLLSLCPIFSGGKDEGWVGGPWVGNMRDKVSPENLPPDWSLLRRSIIRENYENMQNLSATYHGSIQRQCFSNGSYNHNLQRTSCLVILEWQNCFVDMPEAKIFNWIRPSLLVLDRADEEIYQDSLLCCRNLPAIRHSSQLSIYPAASFLSIPSFSIPHFIPHHSG